MPPPFQSHSDEAEDQRLKSEIINLVQYVRRFRKEIAQMVASDNPHKATHFDTMSDQLDAIVRATEDATNVILESAEKIDTSVCKLRTTRDESSREALYQSMGDDTVALMEACAFQDITGQRVSKIIRSMKFVEERVNIMIELWGQDEINRLAGEYSEQNKREGDEALLNGPALKSEASISQNEIDTLFD
jgi:chemotaxis protein CheZ